MRVWAVMYDAGMGRLGILGLASDDELRASLRAQGDQLLRRFELVTGPRSFGVAFRKVQHPEPYYQDNDRVYRCGFLTLWARPFEVEIPETRALDVERVPPGTEYPVYPSGEIRRA